MAPEHSSLPEATQHSTLEYDLSQDGRAAPEIARQLSSEKVDGYDAGKQAIACGNDHTLPERLLPAYQEKPHPPLPACERRIMGFKRKTFFVLISVTLAMVVAVVVGGSVGGSLATHNRRSTRTSTSNPSTISRNTYANRGLAAMQWADLNGTLHKRLYYQDNAGKIQESAWDKNSAIKIAWQINSISDAAKPATPIAAAAGYPHASLNYTLVRYRYISFLTSTLQEAHRSKTCTICHQTTSSLSARLPPTLHKAGKTTTSATSTPPATLHPSPPIGIRISRTLQKSLWFSSKTRTSLKVSLKVVTLVTGLRAILGLLIILDFRSLKGLRLSWLS